MAFWWDIPSHEKNPHPQKILISKNPHPLKILIGDFANIPSNPGDKNSQILKIPNPRDKNPKILRNLQAPGIKIPRFKKIPDPRDEKSPILGIKSPDFKKS